MPTGKLILFFGFCSFIINDLKAQSNFLPGYYITSKFDTVRGFIEFRNEIQNSKVCAYRSNPGSATLDFSPDEIEGYCIDKKVFYKSFHYAENKQEKIKFFRILIVGEVGLLKNGNRNYFYSTAENKVYWGSDTSDNSNFNSRELKILKYLMRDCKKIQNMNLNNNLKENELKRIFIEYYNCVDKPYSVYEKIKLVPAIAPEIYASFVSTKISFAMEPLNSAKFRFDPTFNMGVSIFVFLPRIDERFRIKTGLNYGMNNSYSFFTYPATRNNDILIRYSYVTLPLLLQFTTGSLVFQGGIEAQKILTSQTSWRKENITGNTIYTSSDPASLLDPFTIGLSGGIGWKINLSDKIRLIPMIRYSQLRSPGNKYYRSSFKNIEFKTGIEF